MNKSKFLVEFRDEVKRREEKLREMVLVVLEGTAEQLQEEAVTAIVAFTLCVSEND